SSPALAAGSWKIAAARGALFGFILYAGYDLTNYATLKGWSLKAALIDIVWGTVLTASSATSGYAAGAFVAGA
ncbi:MAG: DUF2177 family protein, partial [Acidobacteria bacterium]|nr:DUF2177 family protein [Acidobacteriota bacterium]